MSILSKLLLCCWIVILKLLLLHQKQRNKVGFYFAYGQIIDFILFAFFGQSLAKTPLGYAVLKQKLENNFSIVWRFSKRSYAV